ncbi:MAG: EF-Tu C-terminal domain-related protein [Ktedonobacterales bacterium]
MALLPEQHDIEVELTLLPTEQGGRQDPAFSGYRTQFYYDGHDWDAVHDYGEVDAVWPGQTVTAYLSFLSPQCQVGRLHAGTEFLLREGQRIVGRGRVLRVLHLEENARQARVREQRSKGI